MIELAGFEPFDATEAGFVVALTAFVARVPEPASRATREGHLTGSAFLVSADRTHGWLIWHEKLGRWLQPGGHLEPSDASPWHGALRELCEETGLEPSMVESDRRLFDLDIHPIPARGDEPEHLHYDLRFLFTLRPDAQPTTGRWLPLTELAAFTEPSLCRLAQKVLEARTILEARTALEAQKALAG